MIITEIRTHILHYDLEHAFQASFNQFDNRRHLLVEVECENGLVGWGECLGHADINQAIVQAMTPRVIGRSALDIEPIWLELYNQFRDQGQRGATINAISGIDVALWDLKGKYFNTPVYQLMGGAFRKKIPTYATGGFRAVGQDRLTSLLAEVQGFIDAGFKALKIKIGFGIELDISCIKAVRELIGPDIELMIDANHGYDPTDAIKVGRRAAEYNIEWFEEPVVPEALQSYPELRQRQPIPVAAGETWHTRWGIAEALQQKTVDIIQPDICGVGGLSEARKIITLADVHHVRLVPHVWGTGIAMAAGLHFHAIIPPSPPTHQSRSPRFEYDQTHNPFREAILKQPLEFKQGELTVPEAPGLGVEIDRNIMEQYKV